MDYDDLQEVAESEGLSPADPSERGAYASIPKLTAQGVLLLDYQTPFRSKEATADCSSAGLTNPVATRPRGAHRPYHTIHHIP